MKDPFADIVSGQNNSDPFADIVASHQQQSVPMSQATSLPPTWSPTVQGQKVKTVYDQQAKGYLLRASILRNRADKAANAISDYSTAIRLLKHPRPELFLQRADLQLLQQEKGVDLALQDLAAARERYGFLYVLQKRAFDIANEAERFSVAITLAVDIAAHMQRKEQWLKRQGDVQQAMGDDKNAQQRYLAALAAIKQLPQRLQRHTDMLSLQQELIRLLKTYSEKS